MYPRSTTKLPTPASTRMQEIPGSSTWMAQRSVLLAFPWATRTAVRGSGLGLHLEWIGWSRDTADR